MNGYGVVVETVMREKEQRFLLAQVMRAATSQIEPTARLRIVRYKRNTAVVFSIGSWTVGLFGFWPHDICAAEFGSEL